MGMSDIEIKRFVEEVVKPFFENDLPLLNPRLQQLRHEADKKAKKDQELLDRQIAAQDAKIAKERAKTLAAKAIETADAKMKEAEEIKAKQAEAAKDKDKD